MQNTSQNNNSVKKKKKPFSHTLNFEEAQAIISLAQAFLVSFHSTVTALLSFETIILISVWSYLLDFLSFGRVLIADCLEQCSFLVAMSAEQKEKCW